MPWGGGTGDKDKVNNDDDDDDDGATLMHKQREIGRVMRMRSAERQVSTNAQGPGPSGSAANFLSISKIKKIHTEPSISRKSVHHNISAP